MNPKVDEFLSKAKTWKQEYEWLRSIVLDSELSLRPKGKQRDGPSSQLSRC